MKFGNLKYNGVTFDASQETRRLINIGDAAELMGIDALYSALDIPKEQIVEVDYQKILDGEWHSDDYVILPINIALVPGEG